MVQIDGTYKLQSQENYKEYLISLGIQEDKATKLTEYKGNVIIKPIEGDELTIEYTDHTAILPINKELEHSDPAGKKHWTTTTLNDDGFTFNTKHTKDGSIGEEKVFKVTKDGGFMTVISTSTKGVRAVRYFKRV